VRRTPPAFAVLACCVLVLLGVSCRHSSGQVELDAVSGIGFSAGAGTSQPIAVAVADNGNQVIVFAFTVPGQPDETTIVGFERGTKRVDLVEGPLPISDSTPNMTTVP
jgi:hypothetical protein